MMVIGIDAHKRSHTAVTVDEIGSTGVMAGRQLSAMAAEAGPVDTAHQ